MPHVFQIDDDKELGIVEENDIAGPNCTCLAEVDAWLAPQNGSVGRYKRELRAHVPSVFVRRIDPAGPPPPFVLPRYCPFCGEAYGDVVPRRMVAPISEPHAPLDEVRAGIAAATATPEFQALALMLARTMATAG